MLLAAGLGRLAIAVPVFRFALLLLPFGRFANHHHRWHQLLPSPFVDPILTKFDEKRFRLVFFLVAVAQILCFCLATLGDEG